MRYMIDTVTNVVLDIHIGGPKITTDELHTIEAERGAGRIGDYYIDGNFYPPETNDGQVFDPGDLDYAYNEGTLQDTIDWVISKIQLKCDEQDALDFEYPVDSGVFYKVTDAVLNTIIRHLGLTAGDELLCNNGCWDNADGTISTPMTVGELTALYNCGYDIHMDNYANMKTHVAAVSVLTTVEQVINYDYSTGWR